MLELGGRWPRSRAHLDSGWPYDALGSEPGGERWTSEVGGSRM